MLASIDYHISLQLTFRPNTAANFGEIEFRFEFSCDMLVEFDSPLNIHCIYHFLLREMILRLNEIVV